MDVADSPPRPAPLRFTLPDETTVVEIPPITVDQARRALRLDPDDGHQETGREAMLRLGEQADVLLGPELAYLCDVLQPAQVRVLIAAMYHDACGSYAEKYARCQPDARESQLGTYDTLRQLEGVCIELATALDKTAAEISAMPLRTAFELCEEYRRADAGRVLPAPGTPFNRH